MVFSFCFGKWLHAQIWSHFFGSWTKTVGERWSSSSQSLFAYLRVKKVGEINASVEEHREGAQVTVNEVTKIATKRATFAATDEKAGDQNGKPNRIKAAKITKFAKGITLNWIFSIAI